MAEVGASGFEPPASEGDTDLHGLARRLPTALPFVTSPIR